MKKFLLRLLIFLIFIPALLLFIFKWNFWNFLAFNLLNIGFTLLGALEMRNFFKSRQNQKADWLLLLLATGFPLLGYLSLWFRQFTFLPEIWLIFSILVILIKVCFFEAGDNFKQLYPTLTASLLIVIYPGLFLSHQVRITGLHQPAFATALYLGMILGNDLFAYLGGRFLGDKTQLNLKISPHKSLIGFLCGILSTVGLGILFFYLVPGFFSVNLLIVILFSLLIALTTIAGDLVESALKRAAELKDSGTLMLGRGGILDSVDSMLISAPVFYFLFPLISG